MIEYPSRTLAVILERHPIQSRWASHAWTLAGVGPDQPGEPRTLSDDGQVLRRLYPGFEVRLFPEEAEGYFLNVTSGSPSVFVALRQDDDGGDPFPYQATLSYNEAARWMDGSEKVERADAWPELAQWIADWVADNYKPEPKQRRKPRSFRGKEGVLRVKGNQ